jgi:hypothetical protein
MAKENTEPQGKPQKAFRSRCMESLILIAYTGLN